MKLNFILFLLLSLLFAPLPAQETKGTLTERELVKARIINSEGKSAVGFRVKISPEEVESVTNEFGYFELDCSTANNRLYVYSPYRSKDSWSWKITFLPEDKDTIHTLTVDWYVSGQVVDSENNSLANMKVEIAGQDKSAVTDWNGRFILKNVTKGEVLKITDPDKLYSEKNIRFDHNTVSKIKLTHYIPVVLVGRKDTAGVMYITDLTPGNKDNYVPNYSDIKSFNQIGNEYTIKKTNNEEFLSGLELKYSVDVGFSQAARLPELQQEYAQGETDGVHLKWMGPETNTPFAWGPNIKGLEYSGANYLYDRNGSLVPKGTGNGIAVRAYDPYDFFRTGFSFKNGLDIKTAFIANSILSADFSQSRINTPVPGAHREAYKGGVSINSLKTGRFTSEAGFIQSSTYDKMINSGAGYARLLHAVYTTPPTFDNRNGLSKTDAVKTNLSWMLANGSRRSYAPNSVNNPYYTVSQLADKEDVENLLAYAKTKYKWQNLELEGIFSFNRQESNRTIYDAAVNPFTRNADLSNLNVALNASYKLNSKINFNASYLFDRNKESFAYKELEETGNLSRRSHQLSYGMTFDNYLIYMDLSGKHYFSNTVNDLTNLFPDAGFNLRLDELAYCLFDEPVGLFRNFRLFSSVSRSLGEAPLLYKNKAVLSTNMHSSQFQHFYETSEILFNDLLKPEIYTNTEIGLRKNWMNNKWQLDAAYFNNTTSDFIAPHTLGSQSVVLENIGKVRNYGYLFAAGYYFHSDYDRLHGNINFTFSAIRNKVLSVHHHDEAIALAGFSNIRTVFAGNEPLGVIYGTSYLRNDEGRVLIDDDGYPMVDYSLKKIGDPTPDFRMALSPSLTWKYLTLAVAMEYSRGGDRWNGTKAYLDYAGMSKESAELRNVKGHFFDGVTQNGSPYAKPVNFYDPAVGLDENRWRRYGAAGVGEAYIEDASYFRLTEIALSCDVGRIIKRARDYSVIKNMEIGTRLSNLLLISSCKGDDPDSNLFGYATGKGLALFNVPSSRSFNFYVNIGF